MFLSLILSIWLSSAETCGGGPALSELDLFCMDPAGVLCKVERFDPYKDPDFIKARERTFKKLSANAHQKGYFATPESAKIIMDEYLEAGWEIQSEMESGEDPYEAVSELAEDHKKALRAYNDYSLLMLMEGVLVAEELASQVRRTGRRVLSSLVQDRHLSSREARKLTTTVRATITRASNYGVGAHLVNCDFEKGVSASFLTPKSLFGACANFMFYLNAQAKAGVPVDLAHSFVVSHELAHALNYQFPEVAKRVLRNRLGHRLPLDLTEKQMEGWYREFHSDLIASDDLAWNLQRLSDAPEERLRLLKSAVGGVFNCKRKRLTRTHPPGRTRYDIIGNHPKIRRALGCGSRVRRHWIKDPVEGLGKALKKLGMGSPKHYEPYTTK